jgi:hypothetical protein
MPSSWTWRRVSHVRTDVSEERIASIIKVTRYVPPKRQFFQELHGVPSQETAFFTLHHLVFILLAILGLPVGSMEHFTTAEHSRFVLILIVHVKTRLLLRIYFVSDMLFICFTGPRLKLHWQQYLISRYCNSYACEFLSTSLSVPLSRVAPVIHFRCVIIFFRCVYLFREEKVSCGTNFALYILWCTYKTIP